VELQVLQVELVRIHVRWDVMLCHSVSLFTVTDEGTANHPMKRLGTIHPQTQRHIAEDLNAQQHLCRNLKSHI
jgi:hypothetical protein